MEERVAVRLLFAMLPTLIPLIRDGLQEAAVSGEPTPAHIIGVPLADTA
jgi:hypothetical protein